MNKVAKNFPQTLALDPGVLVARWSTLKQTLGCSDEQCREAFVKYPQISSGNYLNQYVGQVIAPQRWAG
jgi:hypothetical protein